MPDVEQTSRDEILATGKWPSNAHLIADCAKLGYLRKEWVTLEPTYGLGNFWTIWKPDVLIGTDIDPDLNAHFPGNSTDFRDLPFDTGFFDAVVFDPPYKLNGTPDQAVDARYGVHVAATRRERMDLVFDGIRECARVLKPKGVFLLKCQDQVNGGKVRWQTIEFANFAKDFFSLGLVDRFDLLSYRPQPAGRRQVHARRNTSTLLVFKGGYTS
jgi:SAM-dependent methyltransferase